MSKPLIISAFIFGAACGSVVAQTPGAPATNLSTMNLSPTRDIDHPVYARQDFSNDVELPKKIDYRLPAPGMDASVGLNDAGERTLENEEINQAAAIGFSRPESSVGATIDYRF